MRISMSGLAGKFVAFAVTVSVLAAASVSLGGHAAAAGDPSTNDIMKNGFSSPRDFVNKVNANTPGDLPAIYNNYGLVPSMYEKFASSAVSGTAYKDGRIVVDGQVVGHASQSIGRLQGNGNTQKVTIAGKTYWGGSNAAAFGSNSLPVTVLFNDKGVMQFAVINNCGNPETVTSVTPTYSCDALNKTAVSGQANTYNFTTKASAASGATVVKAVYDFGDGNTATVTDLSRNVQHTFTKSSTVSVTVYVKVPGTATLVTTTSVHCKTAVTVTPPPVKPPTPAQPYAMCTSLTPEETDSSNFTYKFTAVANYGGGVTFNSADFDFDAGTTNSVTMTGVIPNGNNAIISHSYGSAGTHTITAVLHFTDGSGRPRTANCQTSVSAATPPPQYCKPGVVVGSPDCATQLVNTGAGTTAGIFGGVSIVGAAGHYLMRRRNFLR